MNRSSLVLSLTLLLTACSGSKPVRAQKAPASETAPATYRVNFDTSRGPFVVEIVRDQAPNGADRLYNLVKSNFFDGARFYRVVPGFMVQWGSAADPGSGILSPILAAPCYSAFTPLDLISFRSCAIAV